MNTVILRLSMAIRNFLIAAQILAFAVSSLAADSPKPTSAALLKAWAGPDATALDFTYEKLSDFLAARKLNLNAARLPEWSAWMKGLESGKGKNLKAWALTRRVEAGDLLAFPALLSMVTSHLVGISTPASGQGDQVILSPPRVQGGGLLMPDIFRIDPKSVFWASFRKTLKEIPDHKPPTGLYALWSYGLSPNQKDLILELAELVEAPPTLASPAGEPWSDSRFWIVMDWAIACGSVEELESIRLALKEGVPRDEFVRLTRSITEIPGYHFDPPTQLPDFFDGMFATRGVPKIQHSSTPWKEGVEDLDFTQIKILHQPHAPPYPREALIRKLMTNLVVAIVIDPMGKPIWCRPLPGPWLGIFAPTGIAYGMRWQFRPAQKNGEPQYATFLLTMPFRLRR